MEDKNKWLNDFYKRILGKDIGSHLYIKLFKKDGTECDYKGYKAQKVLRNKENWILEYDKKQDVLNVSNGKRIIFPESEDNKNQEVYGIAVSYSEKGISFAKQRFDLNILIQKGSIPIFEVGNLNYNTNTV